MQVCASSPGEQAEIARKPSVTDSAGVSEDARGRENEDHLCGTVGFASRARKGDSHGDGGSNASPAVSHLRPLTSGVRACGP